MSESKPYTKHFVVDIDCFTDFKIEYQLFFFLGGGGGGFHGYSFSDWPCLSVAILMSL